MNASTRVGIDGERFTLNGSATYSPELGFPNADPQLLGTLLNVRAAQAVFDDANYPALGSRHSPYVVRGRAVFWDYPDGPWDPGRNVQEFIAALPGWRACGVLAFTVNLQGGGPVDGNFAGTQPHDNSGFTPDGRLKPEYADRLRRVVAAANALGMAAIVGFFYFGQDQRIEPAPDDANVRRAIEEAAGFLRDLPHRNTLIEIGNETNARSYVHALLRPDGVAGAIRLARDVARGEIPVSTSWPGLPPEGTAVDDALAASDFHLPHTNTRTPEEVRASLATLRQRVGPGKPILINEDEVTASNVWAAVDCGSGWGYYDQGRGNYREGFQSPPVDWRISTLEKWLFFEACARLSGQPAPPRAAPGPDAPAVTLVALADGAEMLPSTGPIEARADAVPGYPVKRVEFFVDGRPVGWRKEEPYAIGGEGEWEGLGLTPGEHTLRAVAYARTGPSFSETAGMAEARVVMKE
ncbi:MAG: Ig-like domain-containing protein [Armatimonadetes bacterium]|nr:Ig-like domain-containing protein [Armatimonadota bacterium]